MKRVFAPAAIALVVLAGLAMTGCTSAPAKDDSHHVTVPGGNGTPLVDPILELTDSSSSDFVASSIVPNLEVMGTGPRSYVIARPSDPKAVLDFEVSCAPVSRFTLTMGGYFSASCGRDGSDRGGIPVSQTPGTGPLTVTIDIPSGVTYWIVGYSHDSND